MKENIYIQELIRNICDHEYARAGISLQKAVNEKIKARIKSTFEKSEEK